MRKNQFIFIVCMLFTYVIQGQSLERRVVANAGNSGSASGVILDYTIGESIIATLSAGSTILTAGFQQDDLFIVSVNEAEEESTEFHVFPNPCTDVLNVYINTPNYPEGRIQLTDITGRIVYVSSVNQDQMNSSVFNISTRTFEEGTYLLSFLVDRDGSTTAAFSRRVQFVR
jgi:hypothetical protein